MHIILVHVVQTIQNYCIKYSTQNQHFAEMFTYSDNTNCNLNFYYFIVSISLIFNLFGNYSYVSDVSDDTDGIFACWAQRRSQRPHSTKQPEFAFAALPYWQHKLGAGNESASALFCEQTDTFMPWVS
jgi:hypothetical protein